ncbi:MULTISPECIES: hypothetical protein [unclassified Rhizobium]|uniref:hypothetical protein n=1 Tax=unclassified Rhizobium TaxID=2613769 RepID=UPI000DDF1ADE|nr:hypothetical protein [Rhizobium sp. CNPSo 4062]MDK4700899.1 hypothetical protein [Rhizobium sp. CNPSo 4062]
MDKRGSEAGHASKTAQRGLWRLMLKLPALRGRLQILAAQSRRLDDLFEAYEEASLALERFQREGKGNRLVVEYEAVCRDIEADIIQHILQSGSDASD